MAPQDLNLRDWFAGQALIGMLAGRDPNDAGAADIAATTRGLTPEEALAEQAYAHADAMLKVRHGQQGGQPPAP